MINEQIIDFISKKLGITRRDMIEKDILLSKILFYLTSNKNFFENYAFKGGTCLIKCYLGYYRFSEDLDFTYINQNEFEGKSEKQIRKLISNKINSLGLLLEEIAKLLGFRFKAEKQNRKYFQFGGSNTFVTMKLWHYSNELKKDTFIKIQVNYRERLEYKIEEKEAKFIIPKTFEKEFLFIFDKEAGIFFKPIKVKAYNLKEILVEKFRAILTRRGIKSRDFIDIYEITKFMKTNLEEITESIIDKTKAMLRFEKYKKNLDDKQTGIFLAEMDENIGKIDEEKILFVPLENDFTAFIQKLKPILIKLFEKIFKK